MSSLGIVFASMSLGAVFFCIYLLLRILKEVQKRPDEITKQAMEDSRLAVDQRNKLAGAFLKIVKDDD